MSYFFIGQGGLVRFSYCLCLGKVSGGIARVVSLIGGFWAGFLAWLGSALAIGYLGNKRVFY